MKASGDVRSLQLTVGAYLAVFVLKLGVYLATGVMALLAESLHTLNDIVVSGLLLGALIRSSRAADDVYMFGYGRAQNVAALVAATLFISFTSLRLYEEAIPRLFESVDEQYENLPLALGTLIAAMALAAAPLVNLLRQKKRGAAARAQIMGLVNDELGLIAAVLGILFIIWGFPLADPIATLFVATLIAVQAIGLFRENMSYLLGRSPGGAFLEDTERTARSVSGVLGVHDLRAEYVGPDSIHLGMHIEVARGMPIEEADRIGEEVRERVHRDTDAGYCVVHVDPSEKDLLLLTEKGFAEAGRP